MGCIRCFDKTNVWGQITAYKIKNALSLKVFVAKMTVNLMYVHNENFFCQKLRMHPLYLLRSLFIISIATAFEDAGF
jgi:hypothetical protein